MKLYINSVEVHPQLSNNRHPVNGVLVSAGSSLWPLTCIMGVMYAYCVLIFTSVACAIHPSVNRLRAQLIFPSKPNFCNLYEFPTTKSIQRGWNGLRLFCWRPNILASCSTILVVILNMVSKIAWFFSNTTWLMVERILEE